MNTSEPLYNRLLVTGIISETDDAKSFELKPIVENNITYEAGQFLTLVFKKGDKEQRRSYSFSSAPALNEPAKITVKKVDNGEYSRKLLNELRIGDELTSSGIAGYFKLPINYEDINQLFFLAAGSGITPVYSLLKTALHTTNKKITVIYSNKTIGSAIFYRQLLNLQEQYSERLSIEFLFSNNEIAERRRLSKVLLNELLHKHTIPLQRTLFYLCAPADYMLVATITLITAGVPEKNIRKENFNTRKHSIQPVPPDTAKHEVTIRMKDSTYQFTVQYPDTILAAAKKLHINLPYSCEAGNCGSCTAICTSGHVWMAYNEVLLDEEIEKGKVLTCQGYVIDGDAELQFE